MMHEDPFRPDDDDEVILHSWPRCCLADEIFFRPES